MDFKAEIREALRGMVREMMIDGALQATVKSVNKQAGTIVATGLKEDIDYFNVRLKAVVADGNGRGILAYPVVGSQVSIVVLDGVDTMLFVSQLSDIESWRIQADNGVYLELTAAGKLLLNGEQFSGLVKVEEVVKKLNKLEEQLNSHQHFWGPPTAPVPTVLNLALNPLISPTLAVELANPNVTHG